MRVSRIIKKRVNYLNPDTTLIEAARYIFGHHHRGLPVVKKNTKKLIGFVTEQDIISELFPSISDLMSDYVHERDFEVMEERVKDMVGKKVKNIMTKKVISIGINDPILKAESIMKLNHISRLPVVDERKNLIGIISKGDIFRALVSPRTRGFK